MYNIDEQLETLIMALKNSAEYTQYKETLDEVKKEESLFSSMREYQKGRFKIHVNPQSSVGEEDRALRLSFSKTLEHPAVDAHLKAEKVYCKLIRQIEDRLSEAIGIDIGFLEE